jgi:hypothetical protein
MPLTVTLTGGQSVVIHSNMQDQGNNLIPDSQLPSDIQWAQDTSQFGTGAPQGPEDVDYKFTSPEGSPLGTTNLEMLLSQGGLPTITNTAQIIVIAGTPDHFAPTADPPTTP